MKNGRLSDDLINITSELMLARDRSEILRVASDLNGAIQRLMVLEKNSTVMPKSKSVTMALKFTTQEISKMDKTFKKVFIANGLVTHVTKRESGKNSFCYEIRYRANGYDIQASSTVLAEAKRKFLEKTMPGEIEKYYVGKTINSTKPTTFEKFSIFYFENFRKRKVSERTYRNDLYRLKGVLFPAFGKMDIIKIAPSHCQKLLDKLIEQGKGKTAVEAFNLLSCIFKNAIAHSLIQKNPLSLVIKPTYTQEHGVALTKEEEKLLLNSLKAETQVAIAIMLFCGLRPNELVHMENPPVIEGEFIKAINSKRHKKDIMDIQYKYIPISVLLRPFLLNGIPKLPTEQQLRKAFNKILPEHKLYDLRTTFYSRCKECGVDQRALDEYMGHSLGKIGNAYTDLSKEFLLLEGQKINY